jgi:hypothetical protein
MLDLIATRPLKRRRLIPRRPHPDLECLFRRQHDRFCSFLNDTDDSLGLADAALCWIGSDCVPLSPDTLDRPRADQPVMVSPDGIAGVR